MYNNININNFFDNNTIPVWFMRQAGRYLPEYRNLRSNYSDFLNFCYTPHAVLEATMQPINKFDFDLSIIFSDILVIPDAMGFDVTFQPNHGPFIAQCDIKKTISNINEEYFFQKLSPVYSAIELVRKNLPKHKDLIGFAGAPWTIAAYIIEGKLSKDLGQIKTLAYQNDIILEGLIDSLTNMTIEHLKKQIDSGADIIQIFDSWAGVLDQKNFIKYCVIPTKKIISALKKYKPNIFIIGFPRLAGFNYPLYQETGVDCISLDSNIDLDWILKNIDKKFVLQGNLDPVFLSSSDSSNAVERTRYILDKLSDRKHIFNLGHGILPTANIETVFKVINEVRK